MRRMRDGRGWTALVMTLVAGLAATTVAMAPATAADGTGSLSGTVTVPAGQNPAGIKVWPHRRIGDVATGWHWSTEAFATQTRADGTWRFDDLPDGTYRVWFETAPSSNVVTQFWGGARSVHSGREVAIAGGKAVKGVDQELALGATASGRVRSASGAAVEGIRVLVYEANDDFGVRTWSLVRAGHTDASGRYAVNQLRAGVEHRLAFLDPQGRGYVSTGFGGPTHESGTDVVFEAGRVRNGLDVVLAGGPRTPKKIVRKKSPKLTGTAKVGRTLKASKGTWRSSVGAKTTVKVRWETKRGKKAVAVKGATSSKLKLTKKFRGKQVRVKVTVKAKGHRTVVRTTKWTKKVI